MTRSDIPLLLSLAVLWAAPLLYKFARTYTRAHALAEKILIAVLAVLVVIQILPESYNIAGWPALMLAGWGLFLPSIVERLWHKLADQVHWVPLLLGTLGLGIHATLDGVALADSYSRYEVLPWAVVLHRFPAALFVWWTLYPKFGWRAPAAVLVFVSAFTVIGYRLADIFYSQMNAIWIFGLFQALVAGSLLHLAFDRHTEHFRHHHH